MKLSGIIRKNRRIIIFFVAFVLIAAGMTLTFSKRMEASVGITAAVEAEEGSVFSGGIAGHPETGGYEWAIFGCGLIAMGAMAFLALQGGWRKEKLFLAIVIPLGVLYLFMMVPFSIPDEQTHYESAYQVSSALLFRPGMGTLEHFDYTGLNGHHNVSSGYSRVMRDLFATMETRTEFPLAQKKIFEISFPVMYLPQALGLALGRLIGGNFVQIFLIGRLFNLLFYTLCVYWAIRLTPRYKTLFLMIGMMPMAIHQAASYNYDAFHIGMAALLFALVFRMAAGKGKITIREFIPAAAVALLLIPAKPTNFPLLLAFLLIPRERFGKPGQKWAWMIGAWILVLGATLLIQGSGISWAASGNNKYTNWEGSRNYSISYALAHPFDTVKVYLNTFQNQGIVLLYQSVGSVFSGQTMQMPESYIRIYLLMLVLCVLRRADETDRVTWKDRTILLGGALLTVALTMTVMFLAWTTEGSREISGLQGRYFIPCLLPMLICLDNDAIRVHKNIDPFVIICGLAVHQSLITETLCKTMLT